MTQEMQGVGKKAGPSTLFYGSVHDESGQPSTLETKIKRRYWETKQSLIEKLGKDQDEHFIADDADIDLRLQRARRLEASCNGMSMSLKTYQKTVAELVSKHYDLGKLLTHASDSEVTSVSKVMRDVGGIEQKTASSWNKVNPALGQLHHDLHMFLSCALTDLTESTKRLEKARTEYRAALLWMKKESGKLSDPDNSGQLSKFRHAQVQVKEARDRYEKLKMDTAEKIEMAVVSRCNMLSKSLPAYQNGLLAFFDEACQELQKVLIEIKANHHPQYRRSVEIMEEQDLLRARDVATEAKEPREQDGEDDDDLLLNIDALSGSGDGQAQHVEEGAQQQNTTSTDEVVAPNKEDDDPLLSLLSWDNSAHTVPPAEGNQVGAAGESAPPDSEEQSLEALWGLLKMESLPLQEQPTPGDQTPQESEDQWDQLSSFLSSSKSQEPTEAASSDWQKELESLLGGNPLSSPVDDPLEDFLGGGVTDPVQPIQSQLSGAANGGDLLMAEAPALPTLTPQDGQSVGSGTLQPLDLLGLSPTPAPHQTSWQPSPMVPSMSTASALPTALPPVAPMLSSQASGAPTQGHAPTANQSKPKAASKDKSGNIYEAWSNIFSRLDPLTNDKV